MCDCIGMLRQVISCKQKKRRWPTQDPPLANSAIATAWYSLTLLKKYKIVFKNHLRSFKNNLLSIAISDLCYKQLTNMQDLQKIIRLF